MITLRIGGETHRFAGPNAKAAADSLIDQYYRQQERRPRPTQRPSSTKGVPKRARRERMAEVLAMLPPATEQGMSIDCIAERLKLSYWTARDILLDLRHAKQVRTVRIGLAKHFTLPEAA